MAKPLTPDAIDLAAVRSLLVVKPSSLGDIVHTLPAVALIKRAHPHLSIRWVVRSEFAPLLEGNPDLDGTIEFPRSEMRGLGGVFKLLGWSKRALREPAIPDLVIDFQGLLRSGVMAKRSGAKQIIGLSDAREGAGLFYDWRVDVDRDAHAVDRYLTVPQALGIDCSDAAQLFRLPEGETTKLDLPDERFVMLHPFSRGEGKSLTVENVRTLCKEFAPLPVVIVGRTDEQLTGMPEGTVDLLNRTSLAELVGIIRRAESVVSVDSGPMHIAAAIVPPEKLVSIHTWSDPRKVGPYAPDAWVWKDNEIVRQSDFASADSNGDTRDQNPQLTDGALKKIAAVLTRDPSGS